MFRIFELLSGLDSPQPVVVSLERNKFITGILCIGDILSAQGKLQPWLFFKSKGLVLNDYLLLLGIYNSFPAPWKNILKSSDPTLTWQSIDPKDLDYNIYIDGENVKLEQLTTKKTLLDTGNKYSSSPVCSTKIQQFI